MFVWRNDARFSAGCQQQLTMMRLGVWRGLFMTALLMSVWGAATSALDEAEYQRASRSPWRIHTLFSVECNSYFDWQTVGLMHSFRKAKQPGPITRLLSCTDEDLENYKNLDIAPTHVVPSMTIHPVTGDYYPAINKPAGVLHWLTHSEDARNVEWVLILDADMVMRHPMVPWELGAQKGKPVAAFYGYLVGCESTAVLARTHTKHPEFCDKVGGFLVHHMDDLRELAPLWLSKTEEVRADKEHYATKYTGDIYEHGWISEMYGYSFGSAEIGLRHQINHDIMIYPGYTPGEGVDPLIMHYGIGFNVSNWHFAKSEHRNDTILEDCNRLFPAPPFPDEVLYAVNRELSQSNNRSRNNDHTADGLNPRTTKKTKFLVESLTEDQGLQSAYYLSIECINTINEGLVIHHARRGCQKPPKSEYLEFLLSDLNSESQSLLLADPHLSSISTQVKAEGKTSEVIRQDDHRKEDKEFEDVKIVGAKHQHQQHPKIHTVFSTECDDFFDWQSLGLYHSFQLTGQSGFITRLLSCPDERLKTYKNMDLLPTHVVPSYSVHPLTGDHYAAINKPAAVYHWLSHVQKDVEYVVILDADMVLRKPLTPWQLGATKGRPVAASYEYLRGCDNKLAELHTRYPEYCQKVGGIIVIHIDDLRLLAPLWLFKTEEVRADREHWNTSLTGDIYGNGWISEMYGYAFASAELKLNHIINKDIMLYPGYIPADDQDPSILHYGLGFTIGNWSWDKHTWHYEDMTSVCWRSFPPPPVPERLAYPTENEYRRDLLTFECMSTLNEAFRLYHERRGCERRKSRHMEIENHRMNAESPLQIPTWKKNVTLGRKDIENSGKAESLTSHLRASNEMTEQSSVKTNAAKQLASKKRSALSTAISRSTSSSPRMWIIGGVGAAVLLVSLLPLASISRRIKKRHKVRTV